jgi:7-dehydrocholesterol reductase
VVIHISYESNHLGVHFQVFNPAAVYDNFAQILTFLTFFSLLMCVVLYFKGLRLPRTADTGTTGHPIRDFFWGTELHPSFMGYYLKQYVNCRLSMTGTFLKKLRKTHF